MIIALFIYLVAIACWLGGIVFFSFFTAPAVFGALPIAEAGKVISTIFPRYYLLGYVAGTLAVILSVYLTAVRTPRLWWAATAAVLAIALGLTFYAGAVVLPRVASIRSVAEEQNPDPVRKAEFDRLHALSVYLNGAVLLLNLAAVAGTAIALTRHA
jgi:Domain of unknown function (DUF4149)